jgi:hypothetical protein
MDPRDDVQAHVRRVLGRLERGEHVDDAEALEVLGGADAYRAARAQARAKRTPPSPQTVANAAHLTGRGGWG